MDPENPADWVRQGQAHEAQNTATALAKAVECYDRGIELLRALPIGRAQRELGVAWMNRGNARQKQTDPTAVSAAVEAYDEAIALLSALPFPEDFSLRNSIGAAWMNRGHALQRNGTPNALSAALQSYDQAIALLKDLPLDANQSFPMNLAAAWLNRAQALLASSPLDLAKAREAVVNAVYLATDSARIDPLFADVTLKAYHTLCTVLSNQLAAHVTPELIAETGDTIDEALALVRHWEDKGLKSFRSMAISLHRFGAQFYLAYQRQFLAEFLLENLNRVHPAGAASDFPELQDLAINTLSQARSDTYNQSLLNPGDQRLQQIREELELAEKQVRSIYPKQLAGSSTKQ